MIKRLMWFASGLLAGASGVILLGRRFKKAVIELTPVRLAQRTVTRTRESILRVREAVVVGRGAMEDREAELRLRVLGRTNESSGVQEVRQPTSWS